MELLIRLIDEYYIYYCAFFWCLLCGAVYTIKCDRSTQNKIYGAFSYIPLAVLGALRDCSVGADTITYCYWYTNFWNVQLDGFFYKNFECGYVILNRLLYFMCESPQFLLVVTSVTITCGLGAFFYKTSPNFYISTLLFVGFFFYLNSFTIFRQYLALVLVLYGIRALWLEKKYYFLCCVFLASTIHFSAIVFLPLILIHRLSMRMIIATLAIVICCSVFIAMQGLEGISCPIENTPYYHYIGGRYDIATEYGAGVLRIIMCAACAAYGVVSWQHNENLRVAEHKWAIFMTAVSVVPMVLGYQIDILNRFKEYVFIFICILLPYNLECYSGKMKWLLGALLIFMSLVYFSRMLYVSETSSLVYKSCF